MIVYIVQMERKGPKHKIVPDLPHRYVVGVYTDPTDARKAGEIEETWRKEEYKYFLHDFVLDKVSDEKVQWAIKELMTENIITKDKRFG